MLSSSACLFVLYTPRKVEKKKLLNFVHAYHAQVERKGLLHFFHAARSSEAQRACHALPLNSTEASMTTQSHE